MLSVLVAQPALALLDLPDNELQSISGTGIAIALDDFQFAMAPTSYFEQVGSAPAPNCTGTGTIASNTNCWRRGDLRWMGLTISGVTGTGYNWDDATTCTAGSLDCPRGGVIDEFSPFDNPYVLRAWSPQGMSYDGSCINGGDGAGVGCNEALTQSTKSIYEYVAPTLQPNYKMTFWGEIEAGATRNTFTDALSVGQGYLLKSQTLIQGNAAKSVFRLFQFTQPGNRTFALYYHSYLKGAFRFSVNRSTSNEIAGVANNFAAEEGLFFNEVDAFVPLGQLYYQALVVNAVGTTGSFYLELTRIPNNSLVYNKHYGLKSGDTRGYETARCSMPGMDPRNTCAPVEPYATADYALTHGYSRWGGTTNLGGIGAGNGLWYWMHPSSGSGQAPASYRNSWSDTTDGIFFRKCATCLNFYAFAKRPAIIDKRGLGGSQHKTQYYNCPADNTGTGCATGPVPTYSGGTTSATNIFSNDTLANQNRTYPTAAVNLGDARIEGLMIQYFRLTSCTGGNC